MMNFQKIYIHKQNLSTNLLLLKKNDKLPYNLPLKEKIFQNNDTNKKI